MASTANALLSSARGKICTWMWMFFFLPQSQSVDYVETKMFRYSLKLCHKLHKMSEIKALSLQSSRSPPSLLFRFTWECWHINCSACTHTLSSPRGLLGACGSNCWLSHRRSLGARDSAAGRAHSERSTTVDLLWWFWCIWDKKKNLNWSGFFFLPLC